MKTISIGNQGFGFLREKDYFYIDKTAFIKEWWDGGDGVTLITRPRRFGKTLNMDMLNCFFSNRYEGRSDLFEGLSIWENGEYQKIQGTYPVLFLTFADIKQTKYDDAVKKIKKNITVLYNENDFLLKGDLLNAVEREQFLSVRPTMEDTVAQDALHDLMGYLSRYYGKNVIVLLDEYDTPLQEAYVGGYWEKMVAFTRGLFNATFKTNPYLERGIMTGITQVSKESIFSDLNNLEVVTTTSSRYATAFGFTEDEVFAVLDEAGMSDRKNEVKEWYDGFIFGEHKDIYNPWSITKFLKSKEFAPHWADTSSNGLVNTLIQSGSVDVKEKMEDLLKGKAMRTELDEQIVFSQLDGSEEAVWSLLLASGYLKVESYTLHPRTKQKCYELKLTNFEVQLMFEKMIARWFSGNSIQYNDFVKALLQGDLEAMNYYMNKVALHTFSFFDTGTEPSHTAEPERFFHGFVLGLMVDKRDDYMVTSNRESGFGRYDVVMEPRNPHDSTKPAVVMEFKVFNPNGEQTLEDTVKAAHIQMREKDYDAALLAKGIAKERIRHYGFAFEGKKVLIG